MIGKTALYTKLAAAARAKEAEEGEKKMVDFKALRAKQQQTAALETSRKNVEAQQQHREEQKRSEREIQLDNLEELIHSEETSNWEKTFCHSVKGWLNKSIYNTMSYKQFAVYQKLVDKILNVPDTTSPIPTRDNRFPDGEYRPPFENRNSFPKSRYPHESVGDDMDDISF